MLEAILTIAALLGNKEKLEAILTAVRKGVRITGITILESSERLGTFGSPHEELILRFLDFLKRMHPVMRTLVIITVPWAALYTALSQQSGCQWLYGILTNNLPGLFTRSITIPGSHRLHDDLCRWMAERGLKSNARALTLTTMQEGSSLGDLKDDAVQPDDGDEGLPPLPLIPDVGRYIFYFQGTKIVFEKEYNAPTAGDVSLVMPSSQDGFEKARSVVTLSCKALWGYTPVLRDFLRHIQRECAEARKSKVTIHRPDQGYNYRRWDSGVTRPKRRLDTVNIDAATRETVEQDIKTYLDKNTKAYYAERGIPYRRGLLLHGPPGTGKTSLAIALASEHNLDIYLMSLSAAWMDDTTLERLFEVLPPRSIVLMEDIDSAGVKRENMTSLSDGKDGKSAAGVTMSALLNVLDGVYAAEGRINIMTTNHPERLDPALVRPGRVDLSVPLGYVGQEVAAEMFERIFEKGSGELLPDELPHEQQLELDIPELALQFASNIPEGEITPAEVQEHLLQRRLDPAAAVMHAGDWVERMRKRKADGAGAPAPPTAQPPEDQQRRLLGARCTVQ